MPCQIEMRIEQAIEYGFKGEHAEYGQQRAQEDEQKRFEPEAAHDGETATSPEPSEGDLIAAAASLREGQIDIADDGNDQDQKGDGNEYARAGGISFLHHHGVFIGE